MHTRSIAFTAAALMLSSVSAQLSSNDVVSALASINSARSTASLSSLTWSTDLQTAAQSFASASNTTTERPTTSQYLVAFSNAETSVSSAVSDWSTQGSDNLYSASTNACNVDYAACPDYAALAASSNTMVGCGVNTAASVVLCYFQSGTATSAAAATSAAVSSSLSTSAAVSTTVSTAGSTAAQALANGFNSADQTIWVNQLNDARQSVTPTPKTMNNVSWSSQLAQEAQSLATSCSVDISTAPGVTDYADTDGTFTIEEVVNYWAVTESPLYDFVLNACTVSEVPCDDYTTMAVAGATQVGCAISLCDLQYTYVCVFDQVYVNTTTPYIAALANIQPSVFNTSAQTSQWVTAINNMRQSVSPPASNMYSLSWNTTLANSAQGYAEACTADISTLAGYTDYETTDMTLDVNPAIAFWQAESSSYNYVSNTCQATSQPCDDYTQIIVAHATQFGCGAAVCQTQYIYICAFDQPYDAVLGVPYTQSTDSQSKGTVLIAPGSSAATSTSASTSHHGLNGGQIAGVVIGVLAGVALLALLAYCFWSRKYKTNRFNPFQDNVDGEVSPTSPSSPTYNQYRTAEDESPI